METRKNELVSNFLKARRQGLSPKTIMFYTGFLSWSVSVIGLNVAGRDITQFLHSLRCTNGGKHGYYRVLRAFYNWLYSPKSGYSLNPKDNPILNVDAPKLEKRMLPSLTAE